MIYQILGLAAGYKQDTLWEHLTVDALFIIHMLGSIAPMTLVSDDGRYTIHLLVF